MVILYQLSTVFEDTLPHLENALFIAEGLHASDRLSPPRIESLNFLREEVARLQSEAQD